MVDALRRAQRLVRTGGCVVDLHPTPELAAVFVGDDAAGPVDAGDAPDRHRAADIALQRAVDEGVFAIAHAAEFDFSVYADSLAELAEHIEDDWRDARIGPATMARARRLLSATPEARPRVRERIRITRLLPLSDVVDAREAP